MFILKLDAVKLSRWCVDVGDVDVITRGNKAFLNRVGQVFLKPADGQELLSAKVPFQPRVEV
ncbi:MAG: hypothetical protein AAFY04_01010, partial [Pseudomonadota bacterium]